MEKLASYVVRQGRLPRVDALGWVARICIVLEVIHAAGSQHGRISAKAIHILGPSCQAGGFFLDHGELTDDVAYQSPERVKGRGPSREDDVWACGVLLYALMTGKLPFSDEDLETTKRRVLFGAPKTLADHGIDDAEVQALLDRLHARSPGARLTHIRELRQALVATEPSLHTVSALKLGRPNLQIFEDDQDDDDGAKLTNVISRAQMDEYVAASLAMTRREPQRTDPMDAPEMDPAVAKGSLGSSDVKQDGEGRRPATPTPPSVVASGMSRGRRVRVSDVALALMLLTLGGGAAYYVYGPRPLSSDGRVPGSSEASTATAATPSASPAPDTPARHETPLAASACLERWLHPDSRRPELGLESVCAETHPQEGSLAVRARIVHDSDGGVSGGMREWTYLGWYRMAVFAAMREHCCPSAAPIHMPQGSEPCSFDPQLSALAIAAATDSELAEPMAEYERSLGCMQERGAAEGLDLDTPPGTAARRTFRGVVARAHSK